MVGALDWTIARLTDERVCWRVLGVAMAVSFVLTLWFTRGTTFHEDDFLYFIENHGFVLKYLIAPHNGHLIFVPRLIYAVVLKLAGARHYVIFRALQGIGIAVVAGAFFVLAKRRVGLPAALAPSILLLFLGSSWQDTVDPTGLAHVYCIAAGLGALIALERPSPRRDVIACALLVVSVATFTVGLVFTLGAAVSIMLHEDRKRRAWVFVVPFALYGAWLLSPRLNHAPFTTRNGLELSNILLIPNGVAVAGAAVAAAVTGLSYDFSSPASYLIDSPWGYVVGAAAAVALVLRLRRGAIPASLWTSLAILVSYWISIVLATHYSAEPNQNRYVYDGVVFVLLVATDAVSGTTISRTAVVVLFAATACALATNIALMQAGGAYLRFYTATDRAELAAVEIARDHVSPTFVPNREPLLAFLDGIAGGAGPYLAAADRNGSFAFTLAELRAQSEGVREAADATLAQALRLHLAPAPGGPRRCLRAAGPVDLAVRPPGLVLSSSAPQAVMLRRFAGTATVDLGTLAPGKFVTLAIPTDRASDPWRLVTTAGPLTVCAPGS